MDLIKVAESAAEGLRKHATETDVNAQPSSTSYRILPETGSEDAAKPQDRSFRRKVLCIDISGIDHFTVDSILQIFSTRKEWCDTHLDPVWAQIKAWWQTVFEFVQCAGVTLIEAMAFTDLVRYTLIRTGFVVLPEEVHDAHEAWHEVMPRLLEAAREIPRTRGYLSLLLGEIIFYETLWKQFWGILEHGKKNENHLQSTLNDMFEATVRFSFLMARANNSFYRASHCFKEMPLWYEWDCEIWRDERWEFYDISLENMLEDVKGEDAGSGGYTNDGGKGEEDEVADWYEEKKFGPLTERDWLTQQMGYYQSS